MYSIFAFLGTRILLIQINKPVFVILLGMYNSIKEYSVQWYRSVIPKVCSEDHWWSARLAEVDPYINQYFVLREPPNFSKWSANQKSLGTTVIDNLNFECFFELVLFLERPKWSQKCYSFQK